MLPILLVLSYLYHHRSEIIFEFRLLRQWHPDNISYDHYTEFYVLSVQKQTFPFISRWRVMVVGGSALCISQAQQITCVQITAASSRW